MTREEAIDQINSFVDEFPLIDADMLRRVVIEKIECIKTPEDMLSALAVVGDMDVAEQKRYFNITMDLTCSFDALYLLVKGCTPDMIFDAVEKYKDAKYKATMTAQKMKVRQLAEEIGFDNLETFTKQLKEERRE